jgi:hypothetical protein
MRLQYRAEGQRAQFRLVSTGICYTVVCCITGTERTTENVLQIQILSSLAHSIALRSYPSLLARHLLLQHDVTDIYFVETFRKTCVRID